MSPAPKQYDPTSRRGRILKWYEDNPGYHRCAEVADALGLDTHAVATASRNLTLQGRIVRHRADKTSLYGVPPTPSHRSKEPSTT